MNSLVVGVLRKMYNVQGIRDFGKSEGSAVIAEIRIQNLSYTER